MNYLFSNYVFLSDRGSTYPVLFLHERIRNDCVLSPLPKPLITLSGPRYKNSPVILLLI